MTVQWRVDHEMTSLRVDEPVEVCVTCYQVKSNGNFSRGDEELCKGYNREG